MPESSASSVPFHDRSAQVPVKQAAYEGFQQALLSGRLRPGQVISQREMTGMLGVSVGALRELLPRLEAEGLLTVMPQRGIQITAINLSMIRDAFQLRAAYEREAVIVAVQRMPDEVLAMQRSLHLEIMERLERDKSAAVLSQGQRIDSGFHKLLVEDTRNGLLIQAYNVNTIRIRLINLDRILLNSDILPSAFSDHLAIIEAIGARDVARSIAAMDAHIHNARQRAVAF